MSEFDQFRKELDDLHDRVVMLERGKMLDMGDVARALTMARAAERTSHDCHKELAGLGVRLDQVEATCLPARRPENTQSASDSPLT